MPFKDRERRLEYHKEYNIKNKERIKKYNKEYRSKNRERILEYNKEYGKEYSQTENGKKKNRISDWKRQGIIYHDYDILYDIYINTKNCDDCNCFLTQDKKTTSTTRCLDHDHSITDNENVRGVVCHSCNCKRG
jgi:hypothetical protein